MNQQPNKTVNRVVIAAGGTGGHIYPALSVALRWREIDPGVSLLWIGTARNRERELCEQYSIPFIATDVVGLKRAVSVALFRGIGRFLKECLKMNSLLKQHKPSAVLAFGGYVSAPVLVAARLRAVPYFVHEQNTVPGLVNRIFSSGARCSFLGFPTNGSWRRRDDTAKVVGTPVRRFESVQADRIKPEDLGFTKKSILICGGSQGAASMNEALIPTVHRLADEGRQIIWQTGEVSHETIRTAFKGKENSVFLFPSVKEIYPFYVLARVVICRSGASTLAELAYFGLPCVLVPLPWSTDNHQWKNAGLIESRGWGVRVAQDENCGEHVYRAVEEILTDEQRYLKMSQKALDNSPEEAAAKIVKTIQAQVR
jgi:UDP-N-acetylglucosamine--N-acetylmuramyl-(pentapeptide) pyrophosphoryl-undecaprenol N-acetylglucosamine transferase